MFLWWTDAQKRSSAESHSKKDTAFWGQDRGAQHLAVCPSSKEKGVTLGICTGSRAGKAAEEAILPRSGMLLPSGKASVALSPFAHTGSLGLNAEGLNFVW